MADADEHVNLSVHAEMDRMARESRDPERLRELFRALDNDPRRIAECLAAPLLFKGTETRTESLARRENTFGAGERRAG